MIGDKILSTLNRLNWPCPAAVIIRHSERPHISSAIGTNDVSLTAHGITASVRLGQELAKRCKTIRLFHSPVLRCAQTANHIHEGAVQAGAASLVMGHRNSLGGSYMTDSARALPLADQLGNKFVRTWFDGGIDTSIIKPLQIALAEHINYLVAELQSAKSNECLDVHITHDWNVMLFREGIFDVRYDQAGWPDFLEGIVLHQTGDRRVFSYHDMSQEK